MSGIASKNDDGDRKVFRLTDLEVAEVSVVDRPANQRPFLVVKRSQTSKELVANADGELVIRDANATGDKQDDKISSKDENSVTKVGTKMSKDNFKKLSSAIDILQGLQGALKPALKDAEKKSADGGGGKENAGIERRLDSLTRKIDKQNGAIGSMTDTITAQHDEIVSLKAKAKAKKSVKRGGPACSQALDVERAVSEKSDPVTWPRDMSDPEPKYKF